MTSFAMVLFIIGATASDLPISESLENYEKYFYAVSTIESENRRYAINTKSSAASYFQITRGAFATAKKRALRYGVDFSGFEYVSSMDYKTQRELVLIDLYARSGTNKYIRGVLSGDKNLSMRAYYKFHHTDPDAATKRRAGIIFSEVYD